MSKILLFSAWFVMGASASAGSVDSKLIQGTVGPQQWVCNAYGHGGTRNNWWTVQGDAQSTQVEAVRQVLKACHYELSGCQLSGCWVVSAK